MTHIPAYGGPTAKAPDPATHSGGRRWQIRGLGDLLAWWCRLSGYYLGIRIVLQGRPSGHDHCSALPRPVFK